MELKFQVKAYLRLRPTLKAMDDIEVSMTPHKVRSLDLIFHQEFQCI